jgi:carbonic anhydrase
LRRRASHETTDIEYLVSASHPGRRRFLAMTIGACAIAPVTLVSTQTGTKGSGSLTKEQRDRLTPGQVLDALKKGNERFRTGNMAPRDYRDQQRTSAAGQFPAAVVLGCIDSRAPAEIVFDAGIGDTFNARIAGNVVNDDLLGSLEYACAVAGAKVLLLFGHTACGAIKGAIDDMEMGNLTGLLARV